jgi:hypothetical protein
LNDLEVAATWIGLLNGWNPEAANDEAESGAGISRNPFYFTSSCRAINDSWAGGRAMPAKEPDCPAYMSFQLIDEADDFEDPDAFFYYTEPTVTEENWYEAISVEQYESLKLCVLTSNILTNFLSNEYSELDKHATLFAFRNSAFCYHPAKAKCYFEEGGCEDENGDTKPSYVVTERDWFLEQEANPAQPTFSGIYRFAGSNNLGLTFCVPVKDQMGSFYAALCTDEELNSGSEDWDSASRYSASGEDLYLYRKPLVLQTQSEDFIDHILAESQESLEDV